MNQKENLSLDDWMLIARCVMRFADSAINDFKEKNMPSMGSAATVSDKFLGLSRDLKKHSELLYKIDDIVMDKMEKKSK